MRFLSKKHLLFIYLLLPFIAISQNLIGAWEASSISDSGEKLRNVVIFTDAYQVSTWYEAESGKFVSTNGGSYALSNGKVTEVVEFDTSNPSRVGTTVSFKIKVKDNNLNIVGNDLNWTRIDDGNPGALQGAWLMSGRVRDGKISTRDTNRPRKTMKILSGTRFQWIAYNTETKQFMGTGGGTYTTVDGKYTENIEFFSRDDSRVGMSLEFDYELQDGIWNHKGFSSKGDPMHEIWSRRDKF